MDLLSIISEITIYELVAAGISIINLVTRYPFLSLGSVHILHNQLMPNSAPTPLRNQDNHRPDPHPL